jgi:hypothetical protein
VCLWAWEQYASRKHFSEPSCRRCRSMGFAGTVLVINKVCDMSYLLDQAKEAMNRAKREAERARHDYNQKARTFNEAKARYDRLAARQFEIELEFQAERQAAQERGDRGLAALLAGKVPALR